MIYKEEKKDLFSVSSDYALANCISADFAMESGVAKRFAKLGTKAELMSKYVPGSWAGNGFCITSSGVPVSDGVSPITYNLVVKELYWLNPTYKALKEALISMKARIELPGEPYKLAMRKIVFGLDRLSWAKVSKIIKEVFDDTDIEILVCC